MNNDSIEIQWLYNEASLGEAVKNLLGCSGQLIKKHLSVKEQRRSLKARQLSHLPMDLVNHLQINPQYRGPLPSILAETEDYLALHKPPGVHSHPLKYTDQDTLLNYLASIGHWGPLQINLQNYDRGLIHRLDFETSGVVLLAKTQAFHQRMRSDFNQQMKAKYYLAIVKGDFKAEGTWTHHFSARGEKGMRQQVGEAASKDSQRGELSLCKLQFKAGYSLVLVKLKTGLRHQIRAQLSYLGYPILGDVLYGGETQPRLFLHALKYEWDAVIEDRDAELFEGFFDLHSALQMGHDVIR
jgi:23S rRNA pseudouridine1911/1915/1917 synthase